MRCRSPAEAAARCRRARSRRAARRSETPDSTSSRTLSCSRMPARMGLLDLLAGARARPPPTRCRRAASRCESIRPAGPAPTMPTACGHAGCACPSLLAAPVGRAQRGFRLSGSRDVGLGQAAADALRRDLQRGDQPGRSRRGRRRRCRARRRRRRPRAGSAPRPSTRRGSSPRWSARSRRARTRASWRRSRPGWMIVYGVTRVRCAEHRAPARASGAWASSTLPTPVACSGSREPIVADHRHRRVPGRAGRGRAPASRRARPGAPSRRVAPYRSCRNGDASCRSPVCTGASRPRSHSRRPTTYCPSTRAAQRAPRRPARRPAGARSAPAVRRGGELGQGQRRWSLVEGAEQRQRAGGHRRAGAARVAGHRARLPPSGSCCARAGRATPSVAGHDGSEQLTPHRPRRRSTPPARVSAEIAPRSPTAYAARPGRAARPSRVLDYPPYRSSVLRHPTQGPAARRPRGRSSCSAPVFGHARRRRRSRPT